jgi:hypothetical protein
LKNYIIAQKKIKDMQAYLNTLNKAKERVQALCTGTRLLQIAKL